MQVKKYIIVLLICLLVTGCGKIVNNEAHDDISKIDVVENEVKKFQDEYSKISSEIIVNIPDNTKIHYATTEEVLNIVTNGTGIIYFGRPTCPWCRNIIPVLASVAIENDMVINYFNPGEVKADDSSNYVKIKEAISDYLRKDDNGNPAMYLPDVFFIKDGEVIGHKLGSASTQSDAYTPLTEEQKQELIDVYTKYIKELK